MHVETPERYLRLRQIVGDPKAVPPIKPIIPVGRSTWLDWVSRNVAPAPLRLNGVTVWRLSDVLGFAEQSANDAPVYGTPAPAPLGNG